MTTGGGTLSYGYDLAGNLTSSTNAGGTTAYTYNSANQLTSTTPPGGALTGYAYNNDGRRTDTWWKTNTTHTTFAAHTHTDFDAAGRIGRTWTARNNLDTTRVFDTTYCYTTNTGAPCPTSTNTTNPTKDLIQWSLDNLGGARSIYTYDGANRLTAVTNYGGHNYTYAYDVNGNRTSTTVDGATTQTLTFNAGNQITTPGYSFNNAGQQTHAPTNGTLTYNGTGQMTTQTGATTSSTYTYAGPGQDELLTQNLTAGDSYKFVYGRDSNHGTPMIDSMTKNGSVNYFDNDPTGTPLAIHLAGGQADFYVLDGNGTPVALIDGTGTQTGTYTYDPYGTQTSATGTGTAFDINPYRHTTGIIDRSTGFIKHGTRWNDTTTGRWTTTDPITRIADPNNANTYTYAADNPTNRLDPSGRYTASACGEEIVVDTVSGAVLGVVSGLLGGPFAEITVPVGVTTGVVGGVVTGAVTCLVSFVYESLF